MKKIAGGIEKFILNVGGLAGYLILFILAFVSFEVVARYVFNSPTNWVWPVSKQVFGVYVILAGSYTLMKRQHIRIEVFYEHYPPRIKTVIRWFSLLCGLCFLGALLWKGGAMGLDAWQMKEQAYGVFRLPLYPLKMFIPVGTALFVVGCLVYFSRKNKSL